MSKVNIEMSKDNMEMKKVKIETTKDSIEMKKVNMEMKRDNMETKKVSMEMNKVNLEMTKDSMEMNKVNIETTKDNMEMKKVNVEMSKDNMEMKKVNVEMTNTKICFCFFDIFVKRQFKVVLKKHELLSNLMKYQWFVLVLLSFSLLFLTMQLLNHRFWMHDFEVYYSAASSFLTGDPVYNVPFGLSSGFYKYSPFALILFLPASIFPFFIAKVLHLFFLWALIIGSIIFSDKMISKFFYSSNKTNKLTARLLLILLPLIANIYTELHLGNINTFLLFVNLGAFYLLLKGKNIESGLLFALGILIKPHFIVFIPLLLLRRKYKCLGFLIAGIIVGLLIPAMIIGIQANFDLITQWGKTMLLHNNSLISSQDTLYSWLFRILGQYFISNPASIDKTFGIFVLSLVSLLFLSLLWLHYRKEKKDFTSMNKSESNMLFEFLILLAIVPNIVPTDSEHFLFSIPLIAFSIHYLFEKRENKLLKIMGISALVFYGMNMREIIGKTLSAAYTAKGFFGLSNILLIIFCLIIHFKTKNNSLNI